MYPSAIIIKPFLCLIFLVAVKNSLIRSNLGGRVCLGWLLKRIEPTVEGAVKKVNLKQEVEQSYTTSQSTPQWPTSSSEAPTHKWSEVFLICSTNWGSSVPTHGPMWNILYSNHDKYQYFLSCLPLPNLSPFFSVSRYLRFNKNHTLHIALAFSQSRVNQVYLNYSTKSPDQNINPRTFFFLKLNQRPHSSTPCSGS